PGDRGTDTHNRVRTDISGETGTVPLRHAGKLYHIGIGRAHARTHILLLVQDLHVRIVDAATGELLRDLTLDPARNYQPTGKPQRPPSRTPRQTKNPRPSRGCGAIPMSREITWCPGWDSNPHCTVFETADSADWSTGA